MENIDISNYIYLIFILLSLVFGALGNRKKNKQAARNQKRDEPSFLEQLAGEMSLEEDKPRVQNTSREEPQLSQVGDVRKKAESLRRKTARRQTIDTSFDEELTGKSKKGSYFEQNQETERPPVDLRQAIIHDAILNRPKI